MYTRSALLALAVLGTAASALAGSIRIAERPTVGPFSTMQEAVDAALEGESLLVVPGNYGSFTIDGKSLNLLVTGSGVSVAKINGQVVVRNIGVGQSVLMSRLEVTGQSFPPGPALEIAGVTGHVRVQDSTFRGGEAAQGASTAGAGALVSSSLNVVFSGCTLEGKNVGYNSGEPTIHGGPGVDAVHASVALYDCTLRGGSGSEESVPAGGQGGAGYRALSYGLFASGCSFVGGRGGGGDYIGCNLGGVGGDGLRVDAAQAHLLENTYGAGSGGWSSCGPPAGPGSSIASHNNSVVDHLPGLKRRIAAPRLVADDIPVNVTITGQSGDTVFLLTAARPGFLWKRTFNGVWMVPTPLLMSAVSAGTIPGNGTLALPRTFSVLTGSPKLHFLQAICVDTSGVPTLTGPAHVLSLDAASGPDCNGNGRHDFVDVLFGGASDCNTNLTPDTCDPDCDQSGIPDACEIANGTSPDCNGNGVPDGCDLAAGAPDCNANGIPDSCDVANHTSPDVNGNGVPDECEAQNLTWYVDDSAAPGGNGSAGAPFQNLAAAIAAAFHGDTIEVADGLYQGPLNRKLNLGGRHLTMRSANGPQQCILDAQGVTRHVTATQGEHLVLEGLTFANGRTLGHGGAVELVGGQLTARDCVFASCTAPQGGGAVRVTLGGARIESCTFLANATTQAQAGYGAAVEIDRSSLDIQDSLFLDNVGVRGGAVYVSQVTTLPVRIAHSSFLSNRAHWGGAVLDISTPPAGNRSRVDDCLFAGNQATGDGGALVSYAPAIVTSCTFVANSAAGRGGALRFLDALGSELHDSVVWGNTASQGSQIQVADGFTPADLLVTHCDVQAGQAGVLVQGGTLNWGAGNLDLDPAFADPDGPDNDPQTFLDNDYSLSLASPCIDAGDNGRLALDFLDVDGDGNTTEPVPWDLRHMPRRVDQPGVPDTGAGTAPITDMGAYER